MRVGVVGGGVVGLAVAVALRREGADVILLERGRCAEAASLGNAGWVTTSLSLPLAAPGAVAEGLRSLFRPAAPFRIRPRLDPALARWLWMFWRSSAPSRYREGARALIRLAHRSEEAFEELRASGVDFERHRTGLVFAALTEKAAETEARTLTGLAELGYEGRIEVLDGAGLRALEPALSEAVVGGGVAHDDWHVRPESLTAGLRRALEDAGGTVHEGFDVQTIERDGSSWRLARGAESVDVDRIVVAAGAWSARVLGRAGARISLEAARGFSVTGTGRGRAPQHALYLIEARVGCSPFDGAVRLAGTLELAGLRDHVKARRLEAMIRATRPYFAEWQPAERELEWAGLRPASPDGLPFIGAVPGHDGLFVATGHGMLGVTLAPGTAALLAPLVVHGEPSPYLEPFRPDRRVPVASQPTTGGSS